MSLLLEEFPTSLDRLDEGTRFKLVGDGFMRTCKNPTAVYTGVSTDAGGKYYAFVLDENKLKQRVPFGRLNHTANWTVRRIT